jgi:hypothetical protein
VAEEKDERGKPTVLEKSLSPPIRVSRIKKRCKPINSA